MLGRLLPGFAGEDESMQAFEAPPIFDEPAGEPIQQFGMGGDAAPGAKVGGGVDQPNAEVSLPDAIHDDP